MLITLGIIGIVAAITIPTLINNYQKTQYVTQLKKAYAATNQALKQMAADNGCIDDMKCTGLFSNNTILGQNLSKYFNVVKNCGTEANKGCFATDANANYDGTSGTNYHWDSSDRYKFITADGTAFAINRFANNCGNNWSTGETGHMAQTCGEVYIDINGPDKKPNYVGKDIFLFCITNGKGAFLYPRGGIDDNFSNTREWWANPSGKTCYEGNKTAVTCTGRVMEEGWQMNY